MQKKIIAGILIALQIFLVGCANENITPVVTGVHSYTKNGVTVTNEGNYYNVVIDYTTGISPRQMGEDYAEAILKVVPNYEELIDSYLSETHNKSEYRLNMYHVEGLKNQIDDEYNDEIKGMASVFCKDTEDVRYDKELSENELYMLNLLADLGSGTQCSYVSVYGSRSSTGHTLTGRNLDWFAGQDNQIIKVQSVTTILYPDRKICSIGYLGYMGMLTGYNDKKDYVAILLSATGDTLNAQGKRSFAFDLRKALETCNSINDIANFMTDSKRFYTVNHNIALADPDTSFVVENSIGNYGTHDQKVKRAVRTSDSKLNDNVTWGISDAVGCVNSFLLYGNYDNHTHQDANTKRWKSMKKQLTAAGSSVTPEELKNVITYDGGSPGCMTESGDLYNRETAQTILFQPDTLECEVFFRPMTSEKNPDTPVFVKIPAFSQN